VNSLGRKMKSGIASVAAMTVGWFVPLIPLAIFNNLHDAWAMGIWTGLFIGAGWLFFAFPMVQFSGSSFLVSDIKVSWLSWSILGMIAYCVLFGLLESRVPTDLLWYSAAVGCVAGITYSLLLRSAKRAELSNAADSR
jgi:hypothetical protein